MPEMLNLLRQASLPADEIRCLQESRLLRLLDHAYRNVPYYRRIFDDAGLSPGEIRGLEDLDKLPITTRKALQSEPASNRLDRTVDPSRVSRRTTSGSSGMPLTVYLSPSEVRSRRLTQFRTLLATGMRWRDLLIQVGFRVDRKPGLHQRLGLYRVRRLSRTLAPDVQRRRLRSLNPDILWAYPSVLQAIAESSPRAMGEWMQPRILISGAEMMPPALQLRIDTELDTECFNYYGSIEAGRIAYECPTHEGLHILADEMIVECVNGGRPALPGESGSVVITMLGLFASPLIRYELGDIVTMARNPCSCGSAFPLMGPPEGRLSEMLVLPDGRVATPLLMADWVRDASPGTHFRIIQHRPAHLEVLFVNAAEDPSRVTMRLRHKLREECGDGVRLEIRRVDRIENDGPKSSAFVRRF